MARWVCGRQRTTDNEVNQEKAGVLPAECAIGFLCARALMNARNARKDKDRYFLPGPPGVAGAGV